ncbi:DUF4190 domain-containing protein [Geodermatophilus sp. SYSU D00079]
MSSDDGLYRGDPPPAPPPPPPGYAPTTGHGPPPGYTPFPGYGVPPGYGPPPGYGVPPGYGPPPGYGLPGSYRRPTNSMAILALVMAFVFAPAGLVLGVVARRQIRETGEEGEGLALAGIIVGSIACALVVVAVGLWFVALASLSSVSFGP